MSIPKAVVLLFGGLDSETSVAQAIADGYELIALSLHCTDKGKIANSLLLSGWLSIWGSRNTLWWM